MKTKHKGYVYKHTVRSTGKSYIGVTVQNPERRWRRSSQDEYCTLGYPTGIFKNAIKSHGWSNIDSEILYCSLIPKDPTLYKVELYFMDLYKTCDPKYGYNSKREVEGQMEHSAESKQKMSKKMHERIAANGGRAISTTLIAHRFNEHNVEIKLCTTCDSWMTLDLFPKNRSTFDGLGHKCKSCHIKSAAKYRPKPLSKDDFKKSYEGRGNKIGEALRNSEAHKVHCKKLKIVQSKPIKATHLETGEVLVFPSALSAKEKGFGNNSIGLAIKLNRPYKNYKWEFLPKIS